MYKFTTTERNNEKASEYETKSLLYLFGCRKDSAEIEVFIVDCFNDVSGANKNIGRLWDVQSKGVSSLNPKKIGQASFTLFHNYLSDITFEHYILFMPKLKEMYLKDETKSHFYIGNFKEKYIGKVEEGLKTEYKERNEVEADEDEVKAFLKKIEFVIAGEEKEAYIKRITSFKSNAELKEGFYDSVFDDIRNRQTSLKNINIDGAEIMSAEEVLKFKKCLWKSEVDNLVITRILGMDLFNKKTIPISYIDELMHLDKEVRKDLIEDCQADIARLLFDKNGRIVFWRFFEKLLSYKKEIAREIPSDIVKKLKMDGISIPRSINKNSLVYLICALKEGFADED